MYIILSYIRYCGGQRSWNIQIGHSQVYHHELIGEFLCLWVFVQDQIFTLNARGFEDVMWIGRVLYVLIALYKKVRVMALVLGLGSRNAPFCASLVLWECAVLTVFKRLKMHFGCFSFTTLWNMLIVPVKSLSFTEGQFNWLCSTSRFASKHAPVASLAALFWITCSLSRWVWGDEDVSTKP